MRELDQLLVGYLEDHFDTASEPEKGAFQSLLELSDPELIGYLLGKERPPKEPMARVVDCIRRGPRDQ